MVNENSGSTNRPLDLDAIEGSAGIVRIDGKTYDLLALDSLGLKVSSRLRRLSKRITELEELEEPSDADEAEYRDRLVEFASVALPSAPEPAINGLSTKRLADLAIHFFLRAAIGSQRFAMVESLTGVQSLPASNGSTAATRRRGSRSR